MLRRLLIFLLLPALLAPPVRAGTAAGFALPDLGSGGISMIAGTQEKYIGRSIVNELRRNNLLLEDPELTEYLQHLGSRLVAASDHGGTDFTFFLVKDDTINAFALPGGYIGVHSGLFLRTQTESELAGVLAHEIAHVTQRHVARRFEAGSSMNLKSLAVLLGAIALAASGADADDVSGAMMLGQGLAIQEQINFTRAQEYESDRIGIATLTRAGFDPQGMIDFFATMQRVQRLHNSRLREFMSTHPLSLSRVSEAAQRIQAMDETGEILESRAYPLMKARLGVLAGEDPLLLGSGQNDSATDSAMRYARGLDLLHDGAAEAAAAIFRDLLARDDSIIHYHIGLGDSLLEAGAREEAFAVYAHAARLFPDNIPLGLAHAGALRRDGQAAAALELLRDLFNRREPQPEYIRTMAQTAADAGIMAESHYYMAEYYLRSGDPDAARVQLQLAVDAAEPDTNELLQYRARLQEITIALLEARRGERRRQPEPQQR